MVLPSFSTPTTPDTNPTTTTTISPKSPLPCRSSTRIPRPPRRYTPSASLTIGPTVVLPPYTLGKPSTTTTPHPSRVYPSTTSTLLTKRKRKPPPKPKPYHCVEKSCRKGCRPFYGRIVLRFQYPDEKHEETSKLKGRDNGGGSKVEVEDCKIQKKEPEGNLLYDMAVEKEDAEMESNSDNDEDDEESSSDDESIEFVSGVGWVVGGRVVER